MSTRSRKETKKYAKHQKSSDSDCAFCGITANSDQFIESKGAFTVIKNIFPYSQWDGLSVSSHLMIVPKKHTNTLSDISSKDAKDFINLISKYESSGYNVYARAPSSIRKTIVHQHTHLIKTEGRVKKLIFTIYRPFYFRIQA